MTALDRALIKAYRATGKVHASAYAQAVHSTPDAPPQYDQHGSEPVLAGPHWHRRPNVLPSGSEQVDAMAPNSNANVIGAQAPGADTDDKGSAYRSPLIFDTTFRMDVGITGVPTPTTPNWPNTPIAAPVAAPVTVTPIAAVAPIAVTAPTPPAITKSVPLSLASKIERPPQLTDETEPQWTVDEFEWPNTAQELARQSADQMDRWLKGLTSVSSLPAKSVAVVGTDSGVGTSTTLLSLGLRAIAAGLRPALIDANSANPALAQQLSVMAQTGWEAVVAGRNPLGRALIESANDRAVLLPLTAAVPWKSLHKTNLQSSLPWQILSTKYDLLLFDAGNVEHEQDAANLRSLCDVANLVGVYAVCDARCTTPDEMITFSRRLKQAGVRVLGTIENFTGTASLGDDVA